ncbi:hypothetical protein WDZ92_32775 [Nostoc sp. NIES-2111]
MVVTTDHATRSRRAELVAITDSTTAAMAAEFTSLPIDPDTNIRSVAYARWDGMPVRLESWTWEAIKAKSAIFRAADVADLDDDGLAALVAAHAGELGETTAKQEHGFAFVNYGFLTL